MKARLSLLAAALVLTVATDVVAKTLPHTTTQIADLHKDIEARLKSDNFPKRISGVEQVGLYDGIVNANPGLKVDQKKIDDLAKEVKKAVIKPYQQAQVALSRVVQTLNSSASDTDKVAAVKRVITKYLDAMKALNVSTAVPAVK